MTVHELLPPIRRPLAEWPHQGHNRWHPDVAPAIEVEPGDEVVVDCRDGLDGLVAADHDRRRPARAWSCRARTP